MSSPCCPTLILGRQTKYQLFYFSISVHHQPLYRGWGAGFSLLGAPPHKIAAGCTIIPQHKLSTLTQLILPYHDANNTIEVYYQRHPLHPRSVATAGGVYLIYCQRNSIFSPTNFRRSSRRRMGSFGHHIRTRRRGGHFWSTNFPGCQL